MLNYLERQKQKWFLPTMKLCYLYNRFWFSLVRVNQTPKSKSNRIKLGFKILNWKPNRISLKSNHIDQFEFRFDPSQVVPLSPATFGDIKIQFPCGDNFLAGEYRLEGVYTLPDLLLFRFFDTAPSEKSHCFVCALMARGRRSHMYLYLIY